MPLRYCTWIVLCLISLSLPGQINFYGDPLPIDSINSPVSEQYLSISSDGATLYFSRENHPLNNGEMKDEADIWSTSLQDTIWTKPENISDLNDADFSSPIGFTADGQFFLYNKLWFEKGIYIGEIWASNGSFEDPVKLDIPAFRNRSPMQSGSLSQDGQFLLVSIETSIGYGVEDLYVCKLQSDGSWSRPKNLGYKINTAFQEITPFLAGDNKTLVFATNGRDGKGSFDLYITSRLDESWRNWSTPVNLEAINTPGAESSLIFRTGQNNAYYISSTNSDGYGDIYQIRITEDIEDVAMDSVPEMVIEKKPVPAISFDVQNATTSETIGAQISLINENGDSLGILHPDTLFLLESEDRAPFRMEVSAQGFLKQYLVVEPAFYHPTGDTVITVSLEPLEAGNTIVLENVLFYRGTANFVEGSENELDLIVEMLIANPDVKILLKGHTDNRGDANLNLQLSEERALAVAQYLLDQKIDEGRIESKGYGGNEPVASNDFEETRRLNRRVEFEVIDN